MDKSPSINNTTESQPIETKPSTLTSNTTKVCEGPLEYGSFQDKIPLIRETEGKCSKCYLFLTSLTIEPAMFLYMFAFMMNMSCLSNLIMDKACLFYFNYPKEVCSNISFHHDEKTNVEKLANNYMLYSNILSVIAAVVMVFIAPWSDKYGRKLPLVMACIGIIVSDVGTVMWVIFYDSHIGYTLLIRLPSELTGGFICFLTIIYSHVADVSSESNRTMKYTTVEIAMMLAMSLGGLAGGMVYKYFGYFYVYVGGLTLHVLTVLWVIFVVEETAGIEEKVRWSDKRKNFFRMDSVSRSWGATVKHREDKGRVKLWMYFLSMCIVILTYEVFGGLGYTYVHHIYNWDPTEYNLVNTIVSLSQFLLMLAIIPLFLKVFKATDSLIGILGTLSMMAKNFLLAFAKYRVSVYYIGNAAGTLSAFTTLAIRTGISKLADKDELGLVFSFLATCEQVFPMIGSALVTNVFNATIDIYPSCTYLMATAFLLIPLITFVWIYWHAKVKESIAVKNSQP